MKLIRNEKSSHWYKPDGTPFFEIEKKDGKGMRNVTVKDARALGLLPSVTTVLGLLAKPQLEIWKQEQAILASLTLPRFENENEDAFAKRVVLDAQETAKKASELGTAIHTYIERYINKEDLSEVEHAKKYAMPAIEWLLANVDFDKPFRSELRLANSEIGFAGTVDLLCTLKDGRTALCDYKSQGTKEKYGHKINFYDEMCWQLSAYSLLQPAECIINLITSTGQAGIVEHKEWSSEDVVKGMAIFASVRKLFEIIKGV